MESVRAAGLIRQIGQALAAAHEKGVWHRDLKPENIMLQSLGGEDHVKLIDFGIVGIQNSRFAGEKTKVAGSLAYMAPEQFAGQPCAASDTYALGVVAYEILTGKLPDPGVNSGLELPDRARRPILQALSLRAELRHSGVREFSEELYRALVESGWKPIGNPNILRVGVLAVAAVAGAGGVWLASQSRFTLSRQDKASVAVLPFAGMSPEKNQGYFSDGLAEELLNALLERLVCG